MPPTGNLPAEAIQYISLEQVLAAHEALIERYGGTRGIRDRGLLESAVFRPQASAFGQEAYPTLFEKCAVLAHSLIKNHPFLDGNKRVGFAAMHLMLLINGWDLTPAAEEEVAMAEDIASGKMSEVEPHGQSPWRLSPPPVGRNPEQRPTAESRGLRRRVEIVRWLKQHSKKKTPWNSSG